MRPIWGRQDPGEPHVGPMNFVIWDMVSFAPQWKLHKRHLNDRIVAWQFSCDQAANPRGVYTRRVTQRIAPKTAHHALGPHMYLYIDNGALLWRHNGRGSISNYQPHDCLLKRLFRRRSKKTSKFRVTGLCAGNSPGTGEFPAQMASKRGKCFHLMT